MIIGIDASNIRSGGGLTHLIELLRSATPISQEIRTIILWSGEKTLHHIDKISWLEKSHQPLLDGNLFQRFFWQRWTLPKLLAQSNCDLLFLPGGSSFCNFSPMVAMSQNLLPFEWDEICRFGFSILGLKLCLLHYIQKNTFQRADGMIFLSQYAKDCISRASIDMTENCSIIAHGVDARFSNYLRKHQQIEAYSEASPFNILYVSKINAYKHQWNVVQAVATLRTLGFPVCLHLIGTSYPPSLQRLQKMIDKVDKQRKFIFYRGSMPFEELHLSYQESDLFVFASSCENLPNILIEAMASGLPIACSNAGPMPEVLQDAGVYFDPEKPEEISAAVLKLLNDLDLRIQLARRATELARQYSWQRCANETFSFLAHTITVTASDNGVAAQEHEDAC